MKSDFLKCLENLATNPCKTPEADAMLIDGAALVNMLKPSGACKTFSDYAVSQLQSVQQIDIIWDRYINNSLKAQTRERRGRGARHSVAADVKLPANWGEFLKLDLNKPELFEYFAQ